MVGTCNQNLAMILCWVPAPLTSPRLFVLGMAPTWALYITLVYCLFVQRTMNKCVGEVPLLLVAAMGKTWVEGLLERSIVPKTYRFWGVFNFAYSMAQESGITIGNDISLLGLILHNHWPGYDLHMNINIRKCTLGDGFSCNLCWTQPSDSVWAAIMHGVCIPGPIRNAFCFS
jgi:hypothetical protein